MFHMTNNITMLFMPSYSCITDSQTTENSRPNRMSTKNLDWVQAAAIANSHAVHLIQSARTSYQRLPEMYQMQLIDVFLSISIEDNLISMTSAHGFDSVYSFLLLENYFVESWNYQNKILKNSSNHASGFYSWCFY